MHLPINRTSLIYSAAGVLAATAITASFVARFYWMRRRNSRGDSFLGLVGGNPDEPSVMEELVSHNWKGF